MRILKLVNVSVIATELKMKSTHGNKVQQSSNSSASKAKKNYKAGERKRASSTNQNNATANNIDKVSLNKSVIREYAGIPPDFIRRYNELHEHFSEEIGEVLAEDINYKLRYIIHEAITCARISSRNVINSEDVADICQHLGFPKNYGAPAHPNWIQGDQGLLYLEDSEVNLIEKAFQEVLVLEPNDTIITKKWIPETPSITKQLENYFDTLCKCVVSEDLDIRKAALQNISTNSNIGPIIEHFYRFGFLLLSKCRACSSVTLFALDLIETLEMCPLGSVHVSENLLKLLVRLILQRLLRSQTEENLLKPLCWVLCILCHRPPLRELTIAKILENIEEILENSPLALLVIVNALGIDAILNVVPNNLDVFMTNNSPSTLYTEAVLECYYKLCKYKIFDDEMENWLRDSRNEFSLVVFWEPKQLSGFKETKTEIDFVSTKIRLIKTRRKVDPKTKKKYSPNNVFDTHERLKDVFTPEKFKGRLKKAMDLHNANLINSSKNLRRQQYLVVGKTTCLLPVLRSNTFKPFKCLDHSLSAYNL